jgi:hypothetical protein
MSKPDSPALQTALAYYDAWRSRDHSTAMNVVADTVVAETPFGRLEGGAALHESETEFANILTGATLIASFGDDTTALLLYTTHTLPVPSVLSEPPWVYRRLGSLSLAVGLGSSLRW